MWYLHRGDHGQVLYPGTQLQCLHRFTASSFYAFISSMLDGLFSAWLLLHLFLVYHFGAFHLEIWKSHVGVMLFSLLNFAFVFCVWRRRNSSWNVKHLWMFSRLSGLEGSFKEQIHFVHNYRYTSRLALSSGKNDHDVGGTVLWCMRRKK